MKHGIYFVEFCIELFLSTNLCPSFLVSNKDTLVSVTDALIFFLSFLSRKWVGGEIIQALAYDVPIPGYKTKNTISLRLWEAKASAEDFNLFQFNEGQYESASQLHSRAQQV